MTRAIAHKDYDVRGGGEVLAEQLADALDCPLYVGHGDSDKQPEAMDIDIREIQPESRWHSLMERGGLPRAIAHMMHWRDNAPKELAEYDTIITSGNEPLWAMPRDNQTLVAYTHSTPRFMYDLYHTSDGFVGRTYQQLQRQLYEGTVKRPDVWVANSDLVARRINLYWDVPESKIHVVYPPVPTGEFSPDDALTEDWYLYLGRLAGHKKVDDVIAAFDQSDSELRIAGTGPEEESLREMAGDNVTFEGYVSETRKRELFSKAKALVYPCQNEDFGMVPIEAMAAGTPVLGVNEGFTQYQIQAPKNGILWDRSVGNLHNAIAAFENVGVEWSEREIADWAGANFGVDRFAQQMKTVVELAEEQTNIDPDWAAPKQTVKADGGTDTGSDE